MRRIRGASAFLAAALFVCVAACSPKSSRPENLKAEPWGETSDSVGFDLKPVDNRSGPRQWIATYSAKGKTAKFRIELGPNHAGDDEDKSLHVSFGKGRFLPEPGSDASIFLIDLKKALEAKTIPNKVERAPSLPFEFAILGEHQSRSADGGFSDEPPGDWTAMKIFLGEGEGEGEVFLNLNPVANKGEFSMKDADYGDIVLAELAKIF